MLVQRRSQRHAVSLWFRRFSEVTTPTTGFRAVLQPLWLFRGGSAKNPCAVGIAVRCDTGRGASATRPFHLLDFRPSKIKRNARKIALFYLVRNTPETGLVRWSVGVCSTSVGNSPHRATRWLTGATSSPRYIRITGASSSSSSGASSSVSSGGKISFPARASANVIALSVVDLPTAR